MESSYALVLVLLDRKGKQMLDSLIFSLNAIIPIFSMVVIGFLLKKFGFIDTAFAKKANKIVFRVFLPALLFRNIYKVESFVGINLGYIVFSCAALVTVMLIGFPIVMAYTKRNDRRGVLLQSIFRSNYALVGIPLAGALFGQLGEIVASLLSAVTVPILNMLAVLVLTVFGEKDKKPNVLDVLVGIIKNPLIQGVVLGLAVLGIRYLFVSFDIDFRLADLPPVMKVIDYLSEIATPLALIALGAQFEFSEVKEMRRELLFGIIAKTCVIPIVVLGTCYLLFKNSFGGAEFAAIVALFATPVAVSTVPMSQEMGADSNLAGQIVVWSTAASSVSIFLSAFVFRLLGVF